MSEPSEEALAFVDDYAISDRYEAARALDAFAATESAGLRAEVERLRADLDIAEPKKSAYIATLVRERDEARDTLNRRGMSCTPDLDMERMARELDGHRKAGFSMSADLELLRLDLREKNARIAVLGSDLEQARAALARIRALLERP